jgi:hypothetical protein
MQSSTQHGRRKLGSAQGDAKQRRRHGSSHQHRTGAGGRGQGSGEHQARTGTVRCFSLSCVKELSLMWIIMARAPRGGQRRTSAWEEVLAARGIRAGRRVAPSAVCVSRLTGFWGHEVGSLGHGERQLCIVPRQASDANAPFPSHRDTTASTERGGDVVIADLGHVWCRSSTGRIHSEIWNHVTGAARTGERGRAVVVSDLGWLVCEVIGARSDSPIAKIFGCIIMSVPAAGSAVVRLRGIAIVVNQ